MNVSIHHQEELLANLVGGKMPRNLSWDSTIELIGQIGEVMPHGNDEFAFIVGSQRAFFKRPSTHHLEVEEISRLRSFLKEAGVLGKPAEGPQTGRMVVVIDHHSAHIYHDMGASRPEDEVTVKPYDPFGFEHHLIHRKEAHYKGDHVPEEDSYYEEIAKDLVHAEAITLIGHATGKSSAVDFLSEYLKAHHPETFRRIIATETADLSALTEPEIEEIAKKQIPRIADIQVQEFAGVPETEIDRGQARGPEHSALVMKRAPRLEGRVEDGFGLLTRCEFFDDEADIVYSPRKHEVGKSRDMGRDQNLWQM